MSPFVFLAVFILFFAISRHFQWKQQEEERLAKKSRKPILETIKKSSTLKKIEKEKETFLPSKGEEELAESEQELSELQKAIVYKEIFTPPYIQ